MTDIAIRVENLSKQYRIGGPQARYKTIRESLTETAQAPFRRLSSVVRGQSSAVTNETLWALKDVSFEVQRGEVVGIIGRNGAGKTTLLKVLSRITEPTEGQAEIHGRVGSLLEVGTGFHPELTGRENIYLNGAILGMKRAEIDRKFDEIVDFAEIEKFMDTPVKHYSSGMYVRLAFAVAAHLEPEILLVDEVLAVGDAAFQKKCLGRMWELSNVGRTVLFVSHNMVSIQALCSRAFLLEGGQIQFQGNVDKVVAEYTRKSLANSSGRYVRTEAPSSSVWIETASLQLPNGDPCTVFSMTDTIHLSVSLRFTEKNEGIRFAVRISEMSGSPIYQIMNVDSGFDISHDKGILKIIVKMDKLMLYPNSYLLSLVLANATNESFDIVDNKLQFTITQDSTVCRRRLPRSSGLVFALADWEVAESRYPQYRVGGALVAQ
jgi:lipopolysaccharide transport system ATP-binding protein